MGCWLRWCLGDGLHVLLQEDLCRHLLPWPLLPLPAGGRSGLPWSVAGSWGADVGALQGGEILSSLFLLGVWWCRGVLVVPWRMAGGGSGGCGVLAELEVIDGGWFLGNWLGSLKQA